MNTPHRPPASRRGFLDTTLRLTATGALAAAGGLGAGCDGSTTAGGGPAAAAAHSGDGPGTRPPLTGSPGPVTAQDLVDVDTLWSWVERMNAAGPRLPGSPAHRAFIDDLDRQLRGYGLTVTRHPARLEEWLARSWSLRVTDAEGVTRPIPVASYRPHSGETGPAGVTGRLIDAHAGDEAAYQAAGAAAAAGATGAGTAGGLGGAIVVVDAPITRLTASVLADLAYTVLPPQARADFAQEDYSRVWLGVPPPPSLPLARAHGAAAMIEIVDQTPELAAGQYTPHQQEHAGLPALRLDREQGARLREILARGPATATLVLTASRRETTVDYLLARLPGARAATATATGAGAGAGAGPAGERPRAVLVTTHTDGQNALEENGGPALLALAEYLSRYPAASRARDLLFLFSPTHMAADAATVKPDAWLREHPEVLAEVDMALAAEHLGALGWDDQGGTAPYRPTGRSEPVAVAVGHSETLRRLAEEEVEHGGLTRVGIQKPFQNGLYGEGTFPYRLGLPTIGMITGPAYLLQVAPGGNLDKLDRALLHRHTVFVAGLLTRMMALPAGRPS
ncbi:hypothetical protein [Parafrankia elaeagni]|uniref:hypothetical protein n=1 Tax=Parafrankia elaeagni TaxID=222534 RepID=UPI0012B5184D|nr:hypothetical protein [Parafrankia elaeagni]